MKMVSLKHYLHINLMHLSGHILYSLDEFLSQPTRRVIVTERMMPSLTILQLKTENEQLCNIRQLNFPTTMLGRSILLSESFSRTG